MAPAVEAYSKSPLFDPSQNWYVLKLTYDAKSLPKDKVISSLLGRQWSDPGSGAAAPVLCLLCSNAPYHCSAACIQQAETFAAGVNALRAFARDTEAPLRTFTARAAAWRALATKPPIPDEVRVQRMMAEDAFKANKPDEALHYYETGVLLYPTWPEGNFNAALISGDLGYYDAAIEHMQAYLELVPDAADAQAARDKILIWQNKAKEK
jgi:tetratricopeptide (TPR) repeat protein